MRIHLLNLFIIKIILVQVKKCYMNTEVIVLVN